ncbi:hypothetical protein TRFO_30258 [Tritrichomonas foetus]|uniref:Uncharacterized protein n=1 Tax=Tritrichomonas foetus TaxID=1144522 RepID=A0A1J4JVS8_9EUKA|nr:hypothetical protein TRFO_30258 [Tritrichomonas foetus]|eukprot:OHT02536.1 hypothetical protein TRFO_30258 [Tritrichomonas foetus]
MGTLFSITHHESRNEERTKAITFFRYNDDENFHPMSFLDFINLRPFNSINYPIVIVEPQPKASLTPPEFNIDEIAPIEKLSYKIFNREIHQIFNISQYKVNNVRIWILKSENINDEQMKKLLYLAGVLIFLIMYQHLLLKLKMSSMISQKVHFQILHLH